MWCFYLDYNATLLGPPGGFSAEFYGWTIYDDKLWVNLAYAESEGFFTDPTKHIKQVNAYWMSWFGSLDEGPLNFACITEDTKNAEKYCDSYGQPYAPAANAEDEIFFIMKESEISEHYRRGLII